MDSGLIVRRILVAAAMGCVSWVGHAQQLPIGSVGTDDATIAGSMEVSNGRAVLASSSSVTAKDRTAEIALKRGGVVLVCATSSLHLASGKSAAGVAPLMMALDRGAVEVRMAATTGDVVMTPDLRFSLKSDGPLDLRLRVTRNGDTCVENRGATAPVLTIADQFGDGTYEVRAGQHLLFEHGNLKEVVDNESSPCGCPAEPVVSVADAGVSTDAEHAAAPGSAVAANRAAAAHPFPAAVSEGLALGAGVPQAPAGAVHAQVEATLSSSGNDSTTVPGGGAGAGSGTAGAGDAAAGTAQAPLPAPAPVPSSKGLGHRIGRFFRRLFGGG